MAETTQLEIVTPARIIAKQCVDMVVAPGVEGLFGVLPRHAPLLADLTRGVVELHQNGKVIDRYMIGFWVAGFKLKEMNSLGFILMN